MRRERRMLCAVLTALAVLAFSHGASAADETQDCSLHFAATLDMRTGQDGRVSIPVKFQNRDFYFMIDTGGVVSTIDPHIAAATNLRLHTASVALYGIGNAVLDHYIVSDSFSIGHLSAKDFYFYVEPASWRGLAGTIAPEILRAYDDDFDFAGGKFHLVMPDHCPGKVIYWTEEGPIAIEPIQIDPRSGHTQFPVAIDGKEIQATMDTGAVASIMSLSAAHRYLDFDETKPGVNVMGGGTRKSYSYPFKALNFGNIAVANPYIIILPDNDMRIARSELILGIGILRQLHMYIAYHEKKIYFTPATAH
jgi:predicted aspartyl protease